MARIKIKNSQVKDKAPLPADLVAGELAINTHADSPAIYLKDTAGAVVKIAGAGAIGGTPATETAAGIVELATAAETTTGTDNTRAVHPAGLKVELDKKANLASPALTGTPTAPTAAAGTNTTQVATTAFVHASTPDASATVKGLVQLADAAAVTAGTAGRVVDAAQLKAAVAVENLWDRTGTVVSPANAGDQVHTATGKLTVGGTAAAPAVSIDPGTTTAPLVRDSSGRVLVGASTARSNYYNATGTAALQVEGLGSTTSAMSVTSNSSTPGQSPTLFFNRSRGSSVGSNVLVNAGDTLGFISFSGNDGSEFVQSAQIYGQVDGTSAADSMPGRLVFATTPAGSATPEERARISSAGIFTLGATPSTAGVSLDPGTTTAPLVRDSMGRLLVGTANSTSPAAGQVSIKAAMNNNNGLVIQNADAQGASQFFGIFYNNAGAIAGSIAHTGATAVAFNTSSDYRLKENITPVADAVARLQRLKPCRFNFIADPDKTVDGFIAHEAQAVIPEAVTGTKDAVDADGKPIYQGIDQSKLVPLLTAALQEAVARIETLEAKVAALESK